MPSICMSECTSHHCVEGLHFSAFHIMTALKVNPFCGLTNEINVRFDVVAHVYTIQMTAEVE